MLNKLSRFFERHLQAGGASLVASNHQKQLAMAALLVEIAAADHHFSPQEQIRLSQVLAARFSLTTEESQDLIDLAKSESEHATSLHQFTQLINQTCSNQEKFDLLRAMWEIAYADGELDKYEDYMIRKLADLLYLPHTEFIRAKSLTKAKLES